jgi:broad specificity phosphatase PhoE
MIFLVRHGQASAGWGEHRDPGLSELGLRQAEQAARTVADLGAIRAVTSPLQRCRETAAQFERLLETHARIEPAVGEIKEPPGVADRAAWLRGAMHGRWRDVEGYDSWRLGALAAIERCADNTAVFTHFVAINAIVGLLTDDDRVVVFRPGNGSVTRLGRTGGKLHVIELGAEDETRVL